jgi:hypothetical protein
MHIKKNRYLNSKLAIFLVDTAAFRIKGSKTLSAKASIPSMNVGIEDLPPSFSLPPEEGNRKYRGKKM